MGRFRWILLLVAALVIGGWLLRPSIPLAPEVAPGSVLVVEIGGEWVDVPDVSPLARLFGEARHPLASLIGLLRLAERDARIHSVVLKVRSVAMGWGKADELRDAIRALHDAGRHPVAHLEIESFGGNLEYYIASAADEVWVSPGTRSPFLGLAAEYLFLGGLWEKLGVAFDVERIGEFKSAAEIYTAKEMSEPHREMANALLDGVSRHFIEAVAASRSLDGTKVQAAIDAALHTPDELKAHGLIDGIAFVDEVFAKLGDRPQVKAAAYAAIDPASLGFAPVARFALIYGTGPVVVGEADQSIRQRDELASETVSKSIREAAADESIDAIVLRVDSPGGSALASDIVWHAVQQAREKKPVIVSMSDLAASGGYYVACGADAIVAQPNTLTGSIGVFVLRPMLAGALEKLGIGYASLQRGEHADLLLSGLPLSDGTRARLAAEVRSVYEQFVDRVAKGRNLSAERVDEIGRGRVWTGAQALEIGLVDGLGGVRAAVAKGREKLKLTPDADVALVPYPAPKPLAQQIGEMLEGVAVRAATQAVGLPVLPPLLQRAVAWLAVAPVSAPLLLPPFAVEIH